jgi:hypothetical protein
MHYCFMADGAQNPWPATVLPGSCGGKVWDLPPVKIVLGGIEPARVKGHVAGPWAYMASATPGGRSRTSNFLRNLPQLGRGPSPAHPCMRGAKLARRARSSLV